MLKEKSVSQSRTFSILMVVTVAALAMIAIFFLTRTLTTAEPLLKVEVPSLALAAQPQVVAGAFPSAESQRRTQLAKAYVAAFGSTSRAQQAETARWNGLAGLQSNLSGSTSRAQQAETARWNGLAGLQSNLTGSTSRAQQAETARWNGLAGQNISLYGSTSRVSQSLPALTQQTQQADSVRLNGLARLHRLEAELSFLNAGAYAGMGDLQRFEARQ